MQRSLSCRRLTPALFLLFLATTGCQDAAAPHDQITRQNGIAALGGCYDPTDPQCSNTPPANDPAPGDSGVWLGPDFTPAACTSTYINDSDQDGFDDFCEFQLTLAFRPLLSADPQDENLTRQSYWAAKWYGGYLDVIYMIGYYFDNGNTHHWICDQFTSIYCWGHFGDSEFIIQRIAYDPASSHWKLASATLSAHYGENDSVCGAIGCDHTANVFAGRFEYPTKRLHYPRVYVALNKHANYYSRGDCNSGGAGGSDDCTYNVDLARVDVNRYRNVGNNFYPRITSTQSTVNPTLYWGTEYFWNNGSRTKFCGWDGPSQSNGRANCSTGYEEILYDFGFGVSIQ